MGQCQVGGPKRVEGPVGLRRQTGRQWFGQLPAESRTPTALRMNIPDIRTIVNGAQGGPHVDEAFKNIARAQPKSKFQTATPSLPYLYPSNALRMRRRRLRVHLKPGFQAFGFGVLWFRVPAQGFLESWCQAFPCRPYSVGMIASP